MPSKETGLSVPELCQLLNSSPLGEVITPHTIRRDRMASGARLGQRKTPFAKYVAWLFEKRHSTPSPAATSGGEGLDGYEAHRERNRAAQAAKSRSGREIGPLPAVANKRRRSRCARSLQAFCTTYFPNLFKLKWSPAHLRCIQAIEDTVLHGGQFAVAMPRGSGKSTLCLIGVIWAIVYGHCRFIVLVNATEKMAARRMKTVKKLLTGSMSAKFLADFPEVCIPASELEDRANRAPGQLLDGEPTNIEWGSDVLTLPTVAGSKCSGSKVAIAGITGEIRGHVEAGPDEFLRPDLCIMDDPQTRSSARSESETAARLDIMQSDVMDLAGPDGSLAILLACTVIQPNDFADQVLNPDKFPDWDSERIPAMVTMPSDKALDRWQEYRELLVAARKAKDWSACNRFYKQHRDELEDGAEHYWPQRKPKKWQGLTALQYTMEVYLLRPKAFWSEYQQQPEGETPPDFDLLTVEEITLKQHNQGQGMVPAAATVLTAFIDIQKDLLYWAAIGFVKDGFTGHIADYNAWPQQPTRNFQYSQARHTLAKKYRSQAEQLAAVAREKYGQRRDEAAAGLSPENIIRRGLFDLLDWLREQVWQRDDGTVQPLNELGVDCSWSPSDASDGKIISMVKDYNASRSANVHPMFGRDKPLTGQKKPGDIKGTNWRERVNRDHNIRFITHRPNPWKSFVHQRFATDIGERGSLSLFSDDDWKHTTFAEHMRAETRTRKRLEYGDTVEVFDEWNDTNAGDNHWFDCVEGCHVLAEFAGCRLWQPVEDSGDEELDLLAMLEGRT